MVYADETSKSSIEMTPTTGLVQSLPAPFNPKGWLIYGLNGPTGAHGLEAISIVRSNERGLGRPLKVLGYSS